MKDEGNEKSEENEGNEGIEVSEESEGNEESEQCKESEHTERTKGSEENEESEESKESEVNEESEENKASEGSEVNEASLSLIPNLIQDKQIQRRHLLPSEERRQIFHFLSTRKGKYFNFILPLAYIIRNLWVLVCFYVFSGVYNRLSLSISIFIFFFF